MKKNYYPLLDLSRFAAAMIVLTYHLGYTTWQERSFGYFVHEGLYRIPEMTWASFGFVGVQIFFVISGFVIANSAARASVSDFVIGRITRIFPSLWICATITLATCLAADLYSGDQLVRRYLASIVLFPISPWMEGVYWTLILEMVFYGIVAGFIFFGRFDKISRLALFFTVYSGIGIIAVLASLYTDSRIVELVAGLVRGKRQLLAWHGVFFGLGLYLYLWSAGRMTRFTAYMAVATTFLCCLQIFVASVFSSRAGLGDEASIVIPASAYAVPMAAFLFFTAVIPLSIRYGDAISENISDKAAYACRTLGLMSYPIYLIHFTLGLVVIRSLVLSGLSPLVSLALASLVILACCLVLALYLEPPLQRWTKQRLLKIRAVSTSFRQARD